MKEKNIGPFSIYDKELPKLIYDLRYNKLPIELRKIIFEEYIKSNPTPTEEKVSKVLDRKQGQEKIKILIKKAIENGDVNLNTSFAEFQLKYEDDSLFTSALSIDREFLFSEAKLKLKKILEESNIKYK